MRNKLAYRNAMRSLRDYFVYLLTMGFIAAFMFAFNMMLFSDSIMKISKDITMMAAMMGLATFFIVLIVAWLINYMVRFMLERRSLEFGTYLLLGMKKKEISRMYLTENVLLGIIAFAAGCLFGCFLQQIILSILYSIFDMGYSIRLSINWPGMLMTVCCYFACYVLALFRNKRKFRSLCITDLMKMDQKNEPVQEKKGVLRFLCFFGSLLYLIGYLRYILSGAGSVGGVLGGFLGFVIAIYVFYIGASAFIIRVINRHGKHVLQKKRLFLYRQLSVKLKTMQFTMGTLTVLFTVALLLGTMAMMLSKYQKQHADVDFPFDVILFSEDPGDTFKAEYAEVRKDHKVEDSLTYNVYQNGSRDMNEYMNTHLAVIGDEYKNTDGSTNHTKIVKSGWQYYTYDTYLTLSDYNHLRTMIGLQKVSLPKDGYILHIRQKLEGDIDEEGRSRTIHMGEQTLKLTQIRTEEFSQTGHNGADYIIVVPDACKKDLTPYYSVAAMSLRGTVSKDLTERLHAIYDKRVGLDAEEDGEFAKSKSGSDNIINFSDDVLVSENARTQMKFILTAVVFPFIYITMVFVCVALTILAVHQLSDSHKYRYRYLVLHKLGVTEGQMHGLVLRQLSMFYLCPVLVAVALSIPIALFLSERFNFYTSVASPVFYYYGISLLIFLGLYGLYFIATYVGFIRNISEKVEATE